ncbi:MAG TPA: TetR/AcrR family transcriptional regulator [Kofleriaceae bacterium]|nr:TetR/AcrR family transcriptional regulator [Kofleriaceae bacterium]
MGYKPVNLENESVQRILRAAMRVWTRDGYYGASLKDVASEAGVAKSLLHYHFQSKEHLLIELQAQWCRMVARAVRSRIEEGPPSVAAALDALDQVWNAMVATRAQLPFAFDLWRESETNLAIRERLVAFDHELRALIADGIRRTLGHTKLALPVERAAALVHTVLDGFSLRLWLDEDLAKTRRIFDDFKTLFLAALVPSGGDR